MPSLIVMEREEPQTMTDREEGRLQFMLGDSDSGLLDVSSEWRDKAEKALKFSEAEISRGRDKQTSKTKQATTRGAELTSAKLTASAAKLAQEMDENHQQRQVWAKTQIDDINDQTKAEIQSLDALRQQQEQVFQAQLNDKNDEWEKVVLERREEAAQLRSHLSYLTSAISVARNEIKTDVDDAKRKAQESASVIRATREKQIRQIAELTGAIEKEQSAFEIQLKQLESTSNSASEQKTTQLARLETNLASIQAKLKEKEKANESKFREQVKTIRDLRTQLQQVRETEKQRQGELMELRKACNSVSRRISARTTETASLKRHLAILDKENEELQAEIAKLEARLFPDVFKPKKA
jgi:hypothetical protein